MFVLDFYCKEVKLAVEVDGNIHLEPDVKSRDRIRQELIEESGIQFHRIVARAIETDLEGFSKNCWPSAAPE